MESTENKEFLSADEFMQYRRNTSKSLPIRDPKNSNVNEKALEILYDEQELILCEERVEKLGSLCQAEFNDQSKRIELKKNLGKIWQKMGYSELGKNYLHPEEALFLLESVRLEIFRNKLPLSVQEAYSLFLDDNFTLEKYQVYSHLNRLGYIVSRYDKVCNEASTSTKDVKSVKKEKSSNKRGNETSEGFLEKEESSLSENGATDDPDGLYIVYESLQRKKPKLQDETVNDSLFLCSSTKSTLNNKSENPFYDFPNIAGKTTGIVHVSLPPERLLPPNVHLSETMCLVDLDKIYLANKKEISHQLDEHQNTNYSWRHQDSFHHQRHRSHHHSARSRNSYNRSDQSKPYAQEVESYSAQSNDDDNCCLLAKMCHENNIKSWKEYKQFLANKQDDEALLYSPAAFLWKGSQKPLLQPKDGTSSGAVRERLGCIQTTSILQLPTSSKPSKYQIDFNVYLPQTHYKKSSPPVPNHRITVVKSSDQVPTLEDLSALRAIAGDNIPLHFAIVDNGNISFYSFNDISLPGLQ